MTKTDYLKRSISSGSGKARRASACARPKGEQPEYEWYCERYGANIEEYRKWFQGINHSVKEIHVVGRPGQTEASKQEAAAEAAMTQLREQLESEARIVITTSDAGKKPKPAIAIESLLR